MRQNVSLERCSNFRSAKSSFKRQAGDIHCVNGEDVAMNNFVIPGGAGTIVTKIVAAHVAVAGEPVRVIINALAAAKCSSRTGLAARRYCLAEFACLDMRFIGR